MVKKNYEEYFSPEIQARIRNHSLDESIISLIGDAKKILEVGAGAGVLAVKLKALGKDVTCVDIKKDYVEYIQKFGIKAICADVNELPFKDNEFELAICAETLEHIENLGNGLKELCRVAKKVIFSLPKNYEDEWHQWNIDYIPFVSNARCIVMKLEKKNG